MPPSPTQLLRREIRGVGPNSAEKFATVTISLAPEGEEVHKEWLQTPEGLKNIRAQYAAGGGD